MKFFPSEDADTFAERLSREWNSRHPFKPMPQVTMNPTAEQLADPLWHEARQIWNDVASQLPAVTNPPAIPAAASWIAVIGGMMCPEGHRVGTDAVFCAKCGKSVPFGLGRTADEKTADWWNRFSIQQMRQF